MFDMKIEALPAVIEAESYTEAVQKLNLAQPVVSHQIHLLKNELDIKIFYRNKNKLKLTPQGKILVQYARRAVAVYSNTCRAATDSKTRTGHLDVGITPTVGETIIPQVLVALCNENPDMHIDIRVNAIQKIYSHLKAYEPDFTMAKDGVSDTALVSTTLGTGYLRLAALPMHRLSRAKAVSAEEIRHEKLIPHSRSAGIRQLFKKYLGARGMSLIELNVMMELGNVSMIKELVTMDLGITIIIKSACREELVSGRLDIIPIENSSMVRQINIVCQKDFLHLELIRNIQGVYERLKAK